MFQVTFDGTTWEEVDEDRTRLVLARAYTDIDVIINEMKADPHFTARTGVSAYRWVPD